MSQPSSKLSMTPEKACKILRDGSVRNHPLSKKQKGMFGALCGQRDKPTSNQSWELVSNLTGRSYFGRCERDAKGRCLPEKEGTPYATLGGIAGGIVGKLAGGLPGLIVGGAIGSAAGYGLGKLADRAEANSKKTLEQLTNKELQEEKYFTEHSLKRLAQEIPREAERYKKYMALPWHKKMKASAYNEGINLEEHSQLLDIRKRVVAQKRMIENEIKRRKLMEGVPTNNRNWTAEERDDLAKKDFAGPHQSYPIETQEDVNSAARLIGHADDPEAVKARIIAIAKRRGLRIPDSWRTTENACKRKKRKPTANSQWTLVTNCDGDKMCAKCNKRKKQMDMEDDYDEQGASDYDVTGNSQIVTNGRYSQPDDEGWEFVANTWSDAARAAAALARKAAVGTAKVAGKVGYGAAKLGVKAGVATAKVAGKGLVAAVKPQPLDKQDEEDKLAQAQRDRDTAFKAKADAAKAKGPVQWGKPVDEISGTEIKKPYRRK